MVVLIPDKEKRFSTPDRYLIVLGSDYNKSDFLKAAQVVTDSYAEEFVRRIYDCLVSHAVDILEEYRKYYAIEYPDLATFLYWKYNVEYSIATEAVNSLEPGGFLGYGSVYSGGDYVIGQLITSEPGLEMVNRIFDNLQEANGESQD